MDILEKREERNKKIVRAAEDILEVARRRALTISELERVFQRVKDLGYLSSTPNVVLTKAIKK